MMKLNEPISSKWAEILLAVCVVAATIIFLMLIIQA